MLSRIWLERLLIFTRPLPFVSEFIDAIDAALSAQKPSGKGLTAAQRRWLSFCVMGVLLTNTICWAKFERAGLGRYSLAALSWMFRHSKLPWDRLLESSVRVVMRRYGLERGVLVIDDTDKPRAKVTSRIAHVHKLKDKTSGGFIQGQTLVLLLLVSETVTVPVGVAFYEPDPAQSAWRAHDKRLKKQGVAKAQRPAQPPRTRAYPSKAQLALRLLEQFKAHHPEFSVRCILADALYGAASFIDAASAVFDGVQVISQLRQNQLVRFRNRTLSLTAYFTRYAGIEQTVAIRGGKPVKVWISSARLYVQAQGQKRFVVALKYDGEADYRFLVASDLSWRTEDIVQAFFLRWLVEVFIEDWKAHEGWGALTKPQGVDGSSQSLILSLRVDHCLLHHPDQLARIQHQQPALTVGSLVSHLRIESLLTVIQELLDAEQPKQQLQHLSNVLIELFPLMPSRKHMVGRTLGRLEPTPSLTYRAAACQRG